MVDIDRRGIVTGATSAAAAGLLAGRSVAQTGPTLRTSKSVTETSAWSSFKSALAKRSDWLEDFSKSAVALAVGAVKARERNRYEPLLLETLLKEASQALDRCLAFRKEAYELEIAAVKAAADYQLFLDLAEKDEKLEINALGIPQTRVRESGYRKASAMYSQDQGFAKHDETLADSAREELGAANERQSLLETRWAIRRRYEADYESRHRETGNAHNFSERFRRIIPLLADDLQEAYEKLLAVWVGIKTIYNRAMTLPELKGEETLEELVLFSRDAIRVLDLERQEEVEYQVVVPLAQIWRSSEKPIVSTEQLSAAVNRTGDTKAISFDLSDVFFNQQRVRLRGVGLAIGATSLGSGGVGLDEFGWLRVRATIHTPKQPSVTSPGSYYLRPPIVLGDVCAYGRMLPVAMRSGPECHNVDPRGEWRIVLNKYVLWVDETTKSIEESSLFKYVADLKLYLNVVAKPTSNADSLFSPKTA
jgi:hypothetical protein